MGCDVSKGYADFVVLSKSKRIIEKSFQLDDTFEGHHCLSEFLNVFFKSHDGATLNVGLESTGGYENNWYAFLKRLSEIYPIKVARLNPLGVKKGAEASMKRTITDPVSAENIAVYMIAYPEKVIYTENTIFSSLCRLWKLTHLLIKQRTQLSNHLESLLYQSHPQLVRYCKNGFPNWILDLLFFYPTARRLAKARVIKLNKISSVTISKAETLINDAKRSVASHVDETDAFIIQETVNQIRTLDKAIKKHKKQLCETCKLKEVDLLCSFIGIANYSAIGLIINIVSIARFPTAKHLTSFFGLHPVYRASGDGLWGNHMSKQGRAQPRAILYMVARSASVYNPMIKQLYEKCKARGMKSNAALGVCMHKILRVVYGMLKTNRPFDIKINERNIRKNKNPKLTNNVDNNRRYQSRDDNAPISSRQNKKRNERREKKEPHKNKVHDNGVIPSFPNIKSIICEDKNQKRNTPERVGDLLVNAMAMVNNKG